ncbi:MAG: hypothetical protein ACPW60_03760 [Methylohalobius sp. ZOD2]|uniref:hypothetical protein n=1 Tax=Methylohalobius crimeensis TaxID=244365 RepID=UPI0003B7AB49|nr:hypothetical protein [Methylohalobius crimeensis]
MFGRVLTSLMLLVASCFLMVLVDHTPGRVGWPEALVAPVIVYAGWQAARELMEWYRREG